MVNQPKNLKSLTKINIFLLFIILPSFVKMTLDQSLQIQNVQISLSQDFSILPQENTKDSLCNDDFLGNVYAQLALTQLQIFKDSTNFANIQLYRNELIQMYNQTQQLAEQLKSFIQLQVIPKPLISPTYFKYYPVNEKGQRVYEPYGRVDAMSEQFMGRLQKDKELYVFIKRTEIITKNTKNLDQKVVSKQKKIFQHYFPDYNWIGEAYIPELFGLQTSEEVLDKQETFTLANYRFWNIRMYRTIKTDDIKQADILMNYLQQLDQQQIDDELRMFACDLYASMLFEFQCLLNLDNEYENEQLQLNFSLFRIIEEKFYTTEPISNTAPNCMVAISPQTFFINYLIGLEFRLEFEYEQYNIVRSLLYSGITDEFTNDFYEIANYFFEFDRFIIDYLLQIHNYHHLSVKEMQVIQQQIFAFFKKTGYNKQQLEMIYTITIRFLMYLASIQDDEQLKQKMTPEGLTESIKFQYLIFTYIRMQVITTGQIEMFQSWESFLQYYITIYYRQLKNENEDELIKFVGEQRYLTNILITIEIITIILYENDQSYAQQVYENMGDTIQHGLLIYFIEGQISQVLMDKINQYKLICDEDFVTPRIIQRVYLEDRVEDMLLFLNEKRTNRYQHDFTIDDQEIDEFEKLSGKNKRMTNFDHLTEKRSFYKTLVQVIYNQQESQNSGDFKNRIKLLIQQYQKNDTQNGAYYKKILQQIDQSQIDFVQRQKQVYQHIYLYAIYEIQLIVDREPATEAFLSFIELYKEEDDAQFSRTDNIDIPDEEVRTIKFLFANQVYSESVDYDDKWNEIIFMDAMFLYPFLYVKHRDQQFGEGSNTCQNYDPSVLTVQEAQAYQISGQSLKQIERQQDELCIEQREQQFQNLLLDEEVLESTGLTQNDFVKRLIFSPEMYLEIEQFEFMVDAFQIFNIYKKINGQRLMTDEVLNDLFFSLYRFIIQIRGDPQFVYDFNFWETISYYIEKCMNYQRFGTQNDKKYYYCAFGYERYNQMYWFIKDAQYKFTGDFEIMRMALEVDRQTNSQQINWGDRTHGRFDYFTHYLVKVKTFSKYNSSNEDMIVFNEDNNWKNEFWDECSKYAKINSNIDYCKFLYKVGLLMDQLEDDSLVQSDQYESIVDILLQNLQTENDKIISWEVLDFFQFEQDYGQDDLIEKIRKIFDSEIISTIKNGAKNQNGVASLSQLLDIQDTKLIGQYGMSKYNQNTTIKNLNEIQYGLQDSKKNFALHNLINDNVLNNEKNIFDFLSLQQSDTHSSKFSGYKLVHHIPLSLLLFYADEEIEFTRIANVLRKTGDLEMMFLSDIKAGEMIIEHFGVYIKKKFKTQTKDTNKYTMKNLETFITGIEKQVSKGRTVKNLSGLKTQTDGQQINITQSSAIANTKFSIKQQPRNIQSETVQTIDKKIQIQPVRIEVIQKEINPNVHIVSDTINDKEVTNLTEQSKISIKRESIQTDLKDQVLEMSSTQKNFQFTEKNLNKDLDLVNNLSSMQTQKDEIGDMENQSARITLITKEKVIQDEPITPQKVVGNIKVEKKQVTSFTVKRIKKEKVAVDAKNPNLLFNENRRII